LKSNQKSQVNTRAACTRANKMYLIKPLTFIDFYTVSIAEEQRDGLSHEIL